MNTAAAKETPNMETASNVDMRFAIVCWRSQRLRVNVSVCGTWRRISGASLPTNGSDGRKAASRRQG